jgi:uncharacterized protein
MIQLLEARRDAIARACQTHGVVRLDVFGSAARGDVRADTSDVDLLVEFQPMPPTELADAYFSLLGDLRAIVARPVDLVMHDAIRNEYVAASIARDRHLLYAA